MGFVPFERKIKSFEIWFMKNAKVFGVLRDGLGMGLWIIRGCRGLERWVAFGWGKWMKIIDFKIIGLFGSRVGNKDW